MVTFNTIDQLQLKKMERGSKYGARQALRPYEMDASSFSKPNIRDTSPVIRQKTELRRNNLNISTPIHTVFLRNLNFDISREELERIASEFGEVAAVFSRARKRGIAFITFYDLRDAQKAVEHLEGRNVNGRELHTSYAYSPPDHAKRDLTQNCSTITVTVSDTQSDENADISLSQIESTFNQFGEVRLAENGKQKNQFIVRYYDLRGARKAVENTEQVEINGKKLNIALNLEDDEDLKSQPTEQEIANDKRSDVERRKYKKELEIKNRKRRHSGSPDYQYSHSYPPPPSYPMIPDPYWRYPNYPQQPYSQPPYPQQPYQQQPYPPPQQPYQYSNQQMMYQPPQPPNQSQPVYQQNYQNSTQQQLSQFLQIQSNNQNQGNDDISKSGLGLFDKT